MANVLFRIKRISPVHRPLFGWNKWWFNGNFCKMLFEFNNIIYGEKIFTGMML